MFCLSVTVGRLLVVFVPSLAVFVRLPMVFVRWPLLSVRSCVLCFRVRFDFVCALLLGVLCVCLVVGSGCPR